MNKPKPEREQLPHHVRTTKTGRDNRQTLVSDFYATTSYDEMPPLEAAMQQTEALSDSDD